MLWITESMEKFLRAYRQGLELSYPVHCEVREDGEDAVLTAADKGESRMDRPQAPIRSFN